MIFMMSLASLDSIKRFKKGKGEKPSFLANKDDEDDFPVAAHRENRGDSSDWGRALIAWEGGIHETV